MLLIGSQALAQSLAGGERARAAWDVWITPAQLQECALPVHRFAEDSRGRVCATLQNGGREYRLRLIAEGDMRGQFIAANGNRPLLANDVYEDFAGAIKQREDATETLETTLIGITSAELLEAELRQRTAFVTVKFVSEQVNVTRDAEGRIVDGDPNHVTKVTDIWTFARNTRSRDPNWALVATRSPN